MSNPHGFWFLFGNEKIDWATSFWSSTSVDGATARLAYYMDNECRWEFFYQPEQFYEELALRKSPFDEYENEAEEEKIW